jgi:hypothetical protein
MLKRENVRKIAKKTSDCGIFWQNKSIENVISLQITETQQNNTFKMWRK